MKLKSKIKKRLKKITGILFIILGIIGLFLPFLQGIVFLIIGATLLENEWILNKINKLKLRLKEKRKNNKQNNKKN